MLEPKKGLYDKFVLLLDFNSLYPSIIQEYNICFTTVSQPQDGSLPPLPATAATADHLALLPKVIRQLVQRRRQVQCLYLVMPCLADKQDGQSLALSQFGKLVEVLHLQKYMPVCEGCKPATVSVQKHWLTILLICNALVYHKLVRLKRACIAVISWSDWQCYAERTTMRSRRAMAAAS